MSHRESLCKRREQGWSNHSRSCPLPWSPRIHTSSAGIADDYLRQVRWPDGVKCPRCGSDAVELRERCDNGLQRFNCMHCAERLGQQFAMFTDWTNSIFVESKLKPLEWLLVIGLWQLKLNATEIAAAADIQARTAQRCINLLGSSHGAQSEVDTFDVLLDAIK